MSDSMSTANAAEVLVAMWAMHRKADGDGAFPWPSGPVATVLERGRHKGWITGPSKPPTITPSGWAALKPVLERLEKLRAQNRRKPCPPDVRSGGALWGKPDARKS